MINRESIQIQIIQKTPNKLTFTVAHDSSTSVKKFPRLRMNLKSDILSKTERNV